MTKYALTEKRVNSPKSTFQECETYNDALFFFGEVYKAARKAGDKTKKINSRKFECNELKNDGELSGDVIVFSIEKLGKTK